MKKDDFVTTTEKLIEEKQNATAKIRAEISELEADIANYQAKIDAYTDVTNAKAYGELKDNLEIRQHRLTALQRELEAKISEDDKDKTLAILNGFISEKRKLDNQYAEEMLEIIRQLNAKLNEAETNRGYLKSLFDKWIAVYKINTYEYQGYPLNDETGVTFNTQRFINTLRITGKRI